MPYYFLKILRATIEIPTKPHSTRSHLKNRILAFLYTDKTTINLPLYAKSIQVQAYLKFNSIIMQLHKINGKTDIKKARKNYVIVG
jgi:hypothetical protein